MVKLQVTVLILLGVTLSESKFRLINKKAQAIVDDEDNISWIDKEEEAPQLIDDDFADALYPSGSSTDPYNWHGMFDNIDSNWNETDDEPDCRDDIDEMEPSNELLNEEYELWFRKQDKLSQDAINFFSGMGQGILKMDIGNDLKRCASGSKEFITLMKNAVSNFKLGGTTNMVIGFIQVLQSLIKLPRTYLACRRAVKGIVMLEQWAQSKIDLGDELEERVLTNLTFKSLSISNLIFAALQSLTQDDYYTAGIKIGEATLKATMV